MKFGPCLKANLKKVILIIDNLDYMSKSFFTKIFTAVIVLILIFGPLRFVAAQSGTGVASGRRVHTPGEAFGKALGAGVACLVSLKIENFVAGLAEKVIRIFTEDIADTGAHIYSVPNVVSNLPSETAKIQTSDTLMKSKECMRDVVAKILLDWLVDQTVEWIQGGGEPRFVTNWSNFLDDAVNVGVGQILSESSFRFLCSPFALQLRFLLAPVGRFEQRIQCTLDQVVSNIENFYNDFLQGGWLAYDELWQPQNNIYGSFILFYDAALLEAAKAQLVAQNQAISGQGFLSVILCSAGTAVTGITSQEAAERGLVKDDKGNYCRPQDLETVTPGSTVGQVLAKSLTADQEWAANIKSWTAAIINAAINRLIKEGVTFMKSSLADSSDTSGNFEFDKAYYNNPQIKSEFRKYIEKNILPEYQRLDTSVSTILNIKMQSLSAVSSTLEIFVKLKNDNCPPAVSDADINNLITEKQNLEAEVTRWQNILNDLRSNILEASLAEPSVDTITKLEQSRAKFYEDHQAEMDSVAFSQFDSNRIKFSAGDQSNAPSVSLEGTEKASRDELQRKLDARRLAEERLSRCSTAAASSVRP
jgi:hypothetical protein